MNKTIYDIIVVGAGNGGLAAAATATNEGKKVLVIDRNLVPGGCATSFRRGRFEFEPSLHEYAAVGTEKNPGGILKWYKSMGVNVNWVIPKDAYRAITLGGDDVYDVTMPVGIDEFTDALDRACPGSRKPMEKLWKINKNIRDAGRYFNTGKQNPLVVFFKYRDFMRASAHSIKEVLDDIGMPRKAQSIVSAYWPYLGNSIEEMDCMLYMSMFDSYINECPAIPLHRSHEISCAVEKAIIDKGGEIWYNTEVTSLIYENGRVNGVRIGDREIRSKFVICNAFPENVYAKMLPPEAVPERAWKLVNARKYGIKFLNIYIGLNKTAEEIGFHDYTIVINEDSDPVKQCEAMQDIRHGPLFINCLNCAIPEASPKGTSMLYITGFWRADAETGMTLENYDQWKNSIADSLIKKCEDVLHVDIRNNIEEIEVCSPATFARYMGTPHGTPYGYELKVWDSPTARSVSIGDEYFVPGLSFAGAHQEIGDGYSSTYTQGRNAALRIVKELNHGQN